MFALRIISSPKMVLQKYEIDVKLDLVFIILGYNIDILI